MKIQNINYHMMISQHKPKYGLEENRTGVDLCGNQSVGINTTINKNKGYYDGSFTGKEKAAVSLSSRILEGLIDACNNHTTIVQNLFALVLALGPRTLAILSLPGKKNKEDKIYAAGHAWASGLIGFGFSYAVMYPLGQAAKKVREDAQIVLNKIDKSNDIKLVIKRLKKLSQEENPDTSKLEPKKLLEGTSLYDENPKKFIEKYGVPYDKEFMQSLEAVDESGKPSGKIDLKKIDYDNFHKNYCMDNLSKSKLLEGTKHLKEKYADKFLKNFVDLDPKGNFVKLNKNLDFDLVYKAVNMAPDVFIFGIAKAMLTIALIPPILKYVFGIEKGKSKAKEQAPAPAPQLPKNNPILNPQKIEGGVK